MKVNKLRKCKKEKYNYWVITTSVLQYYKYIRTIQTLIFHNEREAKLAFDEMARKYFYNKKEKCFMIIRKNKEKDIDAKDIEDAFNFSTITMRTTYKENEKIPFKYEITSEKEESKLNITLEKNTKAHNKFYKTIDKIYKDNGHIVHWHSGGDISVKNK